jgi:hypothetical protein
MKRIKTINFKVLRAEVHYQFLRTFRAMVQGFIAVGDLLADILPVFDEKLAKESLIVDASRKKPETEALKSANKVLDDMLSFIKGTIRSNLKNPNKEKVAAAVELLAMIDSDFKNIQRKDYESEVAAVSLLLDKLRGTYFPQSAAVGINPYFDSLENAGRVLEERIAQRNTEEAARLHETMAKIRKEIEPVYTQMTDKIEVAVAIDTEHLYDTFIAELNEKIQNENTQYHHVQIDLSKGSICVITVLGAPFAVTGHPVTPQVQVMLRLEDKPAVELYWGNDYSVTFKNNVKVGLATVIVHGKGKYKGRKSATFDII